MDWRYEVHRRIDRVGRRVDRVGRRAFGVGTTVDWRWRLDAVSEVGKLRVLPLPTAISFKVQISIQSLNFLLAGA